MVSLMHSARSDAEYEDQIGSNFCRADFSSLKQSLWVSSDRGPSSFEALQVLSTWKLGIWGAPTTDLPPAVPVPLRANATVPVSAITVANPIAESFTAFSLIVSDQRKRPTRLDVPEIVPYQRHLMQVVP